MKALTYADLRRVNTTRHVKFYGPGSPPWDVYKWMTALLGEVGEAMNVVKKLVRDSDGFNVPHALAQPTAFGIPRGNNRTRDELLADLGDEIADAVIYLDLYVDNCSPHCQLGDGEIRALLNERPLHEWSIDIARALRAVSVELPDHPKLMWCLAGLAGSAGIDLGAAIVRKFNATSDKYRFDERLGE